MKYVVNFFRHHRITPHASRAVTSRNPHARNMNEMMTSDFESMEEKLKSKKIFFSCCWCELLRAAEYSTMSIIQYPKKLLYSVLLDYQQRYNQKYFHSTRYEVHMYSTEYDIHCDFGVLSTVQVLESTSSTVLV